MLNYKFYMLGVFKLKMATELFFKFFAAESYIIFLLSEHIIHKGHMKTLISSRYNRHGTSNM